MRARWPHPRWTLTTSSIFLTSPDVGCGTGVEMRILKREIPGCGSMQPK